MGDLGTFFTPPQGVKRVIGLALKFGIIWILNGRKELGLQMVQVLNEI